MSHTFLVIGKKVLDYSNLVFKQNSFRGVVIGVREEQALSSNQ